MDDRNTSFFQKLLEYEHRISLQEYRLTRVERVVDSEDVSDSAIDRRIAKLELRLVELQTKLLHYNRLVYLLLSTVILGTASWIIQQIFMRG